MKKVQQKKNKPKLLAPKCLDTTRKILEDMYVFDGPVHRKVYTIKAPYFLNGEETGTNYDNYGDITFKVEKINGKPVLDETIDLPNPNAANLLEIYKDLKVIDEELARTIVVYLTSKPVKKKREPVAVLFPNGNEHFYMPTSEMTSASKEHFISQGNLFDQISEVLATIRENHKIKKK
ncbi:MAG: hypothetical protein IKW67_03755 [Alphaproteobacteria bacterium]|nr:hypothetical protein [Alphaproteobacteria bacterium]